VHQCLRRTIISSKTGREDYMLLVCGWYRIENCGEFGKPGYKSMDVKIVDDRLADTESIGARKGKGQ
jgi:hypothetical protein